MRQYRSLRRTQYLSREELARLQMRKLREILEHAQATVPFWQERFRQAGIAPRDIRSLDNLRLLPLLTKSDLRTAKDQLRSAQFQHIPLHSRRTSGSTGVPVEVLVDEATNQYHRAGVLRFDEWSGWRLGERVGAIWGNAAVEYRGRGWRGYLRNALLHRATYLDALRLDEPNIERFLADMRRKPVSLLFGHAHSLHLFASYVVAHKITDVRPRAIISAAMVLHDWERKTIEQAFACPVTDRYGCEEVGPIASQCGERRGMHIHAEGIILEVIRADGTLADDDEPGQIVVTDLTNRAMPVIRYQIGDMGSVSGRQCDCGRGLPMLETIEGRVADYVITPSGRMVSGISLTDHFNTLVPGVVQMQIIQEEIDRLVFRIVRAADFGSTSHEKIDELVREHFGEGLRYECEFVPRIPQETSGKFRFCISKVPKTFATATSGAGQA